MQNHQADNPLYVWPDTWTADLQFYKGYGHTWHQMFLRRRGVIKQHKTNFKENQKLFEYFIEAYTIRKFTFQYFFVCV